MRQRLLLLALIAPLAFTALDQRGGAVADDTPKTRRPKPKEFDFGPPAVPVTPGAQPAADTPRAATKPAPEAGDPEAVAIRKEIARLTTWPARDGVHAAESLLLRGPVASPFLVEALAGGERALQPGAAWILGRVGEPAHVRPILQAAARLNGYRAETFFDAAQALDPEQAKNWLIGFLSLDRAQLREEATRYLMKFVGPSDAPRITDLSDSDKVGARVAGLRLLEPVAAPDIEERLVRALSDVAPPVARTASGLLAFRAREAELGRLNALARDGEARERAYAVLALADSSRSRGLNTFEVPTITELVGRRGLLHPDKLNRVCAAVGLAYGALDTQEASVGALLDGAVIDALIDAVGGDHYRDFEVLSDAVFGALRRLSGQDFPSTAVAWAQWWQRERGSFHARRSLKELTPADLPFASVRYEAVGKDGSRRGALFVPQEAGQRAASLLLPRDVFLSLVEALKDLGAFQGRPHGRPRSDEHVAVVLTVRNQESRVTVAASEDAGGYAVLRARFVGLEQANLWQQYRDTDRWPDAATWWEAQAREMEQAEPELRLDLLRSAVVNAWDDLAGDAERTDALERLEAVGGGLTAVQAKTLLTAAAARPTVTALELRAVRLALALGPPVETRAAAVEALSARNEPEAVGLLASLLADSGVESVRSAFADPRPTVRQAAARAATDLIDQLDATLDPDGLKALEERLRPGLEVLRKDEPAVHLQALLALVRLGDGSVLPEMEALYRDGDLGLRVNVTEALGGLPDQQAHGTLTRILGEPDEEGASLRAAALRSIARTRHPNAVRLLSFYLLSDMSAEVQDAAADALVGLGSDEARFAVIEALTRGEKDAQRRARLVDVIGRFDGRIVEEVLTRQLDDAAPEVVAVAALRAGEKGLPAAVPHLIALLRRGSDVERDQALRVLEDLTYQRLAAPGFGVKADQYEAWWGSAKVGSERGWFRDALVAHGYDASMMVGYVRGEASLAAVPVLLRALRDEDPLLRQGAARALERSAGRSFGAVNRSVPLSDVERIADRWSAWWETEGLAAAAGR